MVTEKKFTVNIFEQECHGVMQYRVMRKDGQKFMGCIQIDFENEEEAIRLTLAELRRNGLEADVMYHPLNYHVQGGVRKVQ